MKYFLYALCLAFVILKLTNYIDWSWWIVFAPIWGSWILAIVLVVLSVIIKIKEERQKNIKAFNNPNKNSRFQERLDSYMEQQNKYKLKS